MNLSVLAVLKCAVYSKFFCLLAFGDILTSSQEKANEFPGKSAYPLHYYHIKGTSPIDCWYIFTIVTYQAHPVRPGSVDSLNGGSTDAMKKAPVEI